MSGLYSRSFKKRKVISLAPDAIVRINGLVEVEICTDCNGYIFLSEYITNVSTSLATNGTVGTANFTVAMPRHGHESKYMIRKGKVHGIKLMDEVEIFIKGRFKKGNDYESKYYKVFWGFVINIQESYSDGFLNLSVGCESILKWLQIMKTNENPAALSFSNSATKVSDFATARFTNKSYANLNPYEIIVSLCIATYRNIVTPTALDTEAINVTAEDGRLSQQIWSPEEEDLIRYWAERFSKLSERLKLFGVKKDDLQRITNTVKNDASGNGSFKGSVSSNTFIPFLVNYNNTNLMDFRPFFNKDEARSEIEYSASSYKSNLEIANEVKLHTGFEFYLDTNGEIIFKPPFWNMDTRLNSVFYLRDSDILSYDFSEDANQVVTRLDVTGEIFSELVTTTPLKPRATFTDWALARQFGIKEELIVARYYKRPEMCFYHAISELDRINANRYSGSVTIIGRPELRLGYPVYIESRELFGYVENISHNFSFGGSFTTQVEISAIRRKHKFKNRVLRPAAKVSPDPVLQSMNSQEQQNYNIPNIGEIYGNYKTNRNVKFEEVDATTPEASEIIRKLQEAKKSGNATEYLKNLEQFIPVSDEEGFELVGTYENGRRFYLTSDFKIRYKDSTFKEGKKSPTPVNTNNQAPDNGTGTEKILKGNLDIAKDPSSSNPDINYTPADSGVRDSLEEDVISDFSQTTAIFASALSPKDDAGRGCSCSENKNSNIPKNPTDTSKKTMNDVKKKRKR